MSKELKKNNKTKAKPKKTMSNTATKTTVNKLKNVTTQKMNSNIPTTIQKRKVIDFDRIDGIDDEDDVTLSAMNRANLQNLWDVDYHVVDVFSTDDDDPNSNPLIEGLDAQDQIENIIEAYAGLEPQDNMFSEKE